jgi:hypothetical protein
MFDEDARIDTPTTAPTSSELEEFRAYRDGRIRAAALAQGRAEASAEQQAAEASADADALSYLAAKGLSLKECFGNARTRRGHDVLAIMHGSQTHRKAYVTLRRMAVAEGLVR